MKALMLNLKLIWTVGLILLLNAACASNDVHLAKENLDPKAIEKSKPFLADHYALDFRFVSTGGICNEPVGLRGVSDDWKSWVVNAGACVEKQDWARVEKMATEMSARQPESPWGAYFLALAAGSRGDLLRANWMLGLAERKAGGSIGLVRYEKARLLEADEDAAHSRPLAVKEMQTAVRVDPTLVPGLLWLAELYHRDRDLTTAANYYRQVLNRKPDSAPALTNLADIMTESGNGIEASSLLTHAIEVRPEVALNYVKLAGVYENMTKEPAKALQALRDLKDAMSKGRARGKVSVDGPFNIDVKIKALQEQIKRQPAGQAEKTEKPK